MNQWKSGRLVNYTSTKNKNYKHQVTFFPTSKYIAMNTKNFNAIGPEFFEWFEALNKHQWKAIPRR